MALSVGIIGLPNVGKSTLFNALTASRVVAANYPFATIDPNKAVVRVFDERVRALANRFNPLKTIYATIEFNDIAGLVRGASKGEGLGNQFLAHIRETDALIQVVRCFEQENIIHVEQGIDAERDIETINIELIIKDLETLLKRKERVETKARVNRDKDAIFELNIINKFIAQLENDLPLRLLTLTEEEQKYGMRVLMLLTLKPMIYIANISDDYSNFATNKHYQATKAVAERERTTVIPVSIAFEEELIRLSEEEREFYLKDLGITKLGLHEVVKSAYDLLGVNTFFTVGEKEVHAWTFTEGMKAPACAGVIHSDFERGFIRAEVYNYADFLKYGSESAIKESGKMRSEGKNYVMQDGDIVHFLFNV